MEDVASSAQLDRVQNYLQVLEAENKLILIWEIECFLFLRAGGGTDNEAAGGVGYQAEQGGEVAGEQEDFQRKRESKSPPSQKIGTAALRMMKKESPKHKIFQENLLSKKSTLQGQILEAKGLQSNTDRRGKNIRGILQRHLDEKNVKVRVERRNLTLNITISSEVYLKLYLVFLASR